MVERIGTCRVLGEIGSGGMAVVYEAIQEPLNRRVAIKALKPSIAIDSQFAERFEREARLLARLDHPGVVRVHDAGRAGRWYWLAMEYVDGVDLRQLMRAGEVRPPQALSIVAQLCEALQYAHDHGVVHRDVKPSNIRLSDDGHVKLLDFGLAKRLEQGTQSPEARKTTTLTLQGAIFGTPSAMSPEQALGRPVDERSDVFSFGSLLYEMAAGGPAFRGGTVMEVIDAVIHREPAALSQARPDFPDEFASFVGKVLR